MNSPRSFLLGFLSLLGAGMAYASPDTNGNGLSDVFERHYNGNVLFSASDPKHAPAADPDGDGWTTAQEHLAGTNPFSTVLPLGMVRCNILQHPETPGLFVLSWNSQLGKNYQLRTSSDLVSWADMGELIPGTGADIQLNIRASDDEGGYPDKLFWRISVKDEDSDGDGLSNWEELITGTNPQVPDNGNGLTPTPGDSDGDGLIDEEEELRGSNPGTKDSDGDGLDDASDAIPWDDNARWPMIAETRYTVVPLGKPDGVTEEEGDGIGNDMGRTVSHSFLSSPGGTSAWTLSALGKNGHVVLVVDDRSTVNVTQRDVTRAADAFRSYIWDPSTGEWSPLATKSTAQDYAGYGMSVDAGGNVTGVGVVPLADQNGDPMAGPGLAPVVIHWAKDAYAAPTMHFHGLGLKVHDKFTPQNDALMVQSQLQVFAQENGAPVIADFVYSPYPNNGRWKAWKGAEQTYWDLDLNTDGPGSLHGVSSDGDVIGYVPGSGTRLHTALGGERAGPDSYSAIGIAMPGRTYSSTGAILTEGTPAILSSDLWLSGETGNWVKLKDHPNGTLMKGGAINLHGLMLAGDRILRNGRSIAMADLVPDQSFDDFALHRLNDSGAIAATARNTASGRREPVLLLPVGAFGPGGRTHEIKASDAIPRVELTGLNSAAVRVQGDSATISFRLNVRDPLARLLPPGAPGVATQAKSYVDGMERSAIALTRTEGGGGSFWAPHGDSFTSPEVEVEVPSRGMSRVRIETVENAAGQRGSAEFDVIFREIFAPPVVIPATSLNLTLHLPAALDPLAPDTLDIGTGNQTLALQETENASGVFAAPNVAWRVVIPPGYAADPQAVDKPAIRVYPTQGAAASSGGTTAICTETGSATLEFTYHENTPAREIVSPSTWQFEGISPVVSDGVVGPGEPWFPFTLVMPRMEGLEVEVLDQTLASGVSTVTRPGGSPDERVLQTATGKPWIAAVVRQQDFEGEVPEESFELIYFDENTHSLVKRPIDSSLVKLPFKIRQGEIDHGELELPFKRIRMTDEGGLASPGLVPVAIEQLRRLLKGESVPEIGQENTCRILLQGYRAGEVLRFGGGEVGADFFDLVAGDEGAYLTPNDRHIRLEATGERTFRSREKLIFYNDSALEGEDRLTPAEWRDLKGRGFVAIHNPPEKVFRGKDDLEWLVKEYGSIHPGEADKMFGDLNPSLPRIDKNYLRYDGFQDHHLFNRYHGSSAKRLRWDQLFAGELDIDAFTVPVRKEVHQKIQHLSNIEWKTFLGECFDEATHDLKPELAANPALLRQKQGEAMKIMRKLVKETGLNIDLVRPWPALLGERGAAGHPLFKTLTESDKTVGSSFEHLLHLDARFTSALGEEAVEEARRFYRTAMKRHLTRWGGKALVGIIIFGSYQTHADTLRLLVDTSAFGPREGGSQWINRTYDLEDIELSRRIMDRNWEAFQDFINGGVRVPAAPMRAGRAVTLGQRSFTCEFDLSGKVVSVTPRVVVWIKQLPDGVVKVATRKSVSSNEELVEEWNYVITDYFPVVGDSRSLYDEAWKRANAGN